MFFREVIGQENNKGNLIQSILENRIPHAVLFTGPEGCGKLPLALAYAQYISCENRTPHDSCGTCKSCIKYNKLSHPDLHFIFPVFKGDKIKNPISNDYISQWRDMINQNPYFSTQSWYAVLESENRQGGIYVSESDHLIKILQYKTYESVFKIFILWLPEKMQPECANKLLKSIEEPPSNTVFLMVSENPEQVLPTILSRTQIIRIPRIEDHRLLEALEKNYSMNEEQLADIVRMANGNYIRAAEIIQASENTGQFLQWFSLFMRYSYKPMIPELIKWVDKISAAGREKQKSFLRYCQQMIRENFILHVYEGKNEKINFLSPEEEDFSVKFSVFINPKNVLLISEEFNKALYHIERNGYAKTIFLDLGFILNKLLKM